MIPAKEIVTTILGFDIGGTKTAVVLGDLSGNIYLRKEYPTPVSESFEAAVNMMAALGDELIQEAVEEGYPKPCAVSAAVGGPLDIERGIIYSPPHLPSWDQAPLKSRLHKHFGLPVFIEHDGNAGALAEFYFGAGKGVRNLIYLTMGTGLGAGIILDGRIYHGTSDTAGEVGHMRISEDGPVEYGKAGSWEGYCSASGLAKLAAEQNPGKWPVDTAPSHIIQAALAGDEAAVDLVQEMGTWLGKGLAVLVDVLNPEVIVIGTLGVVLGDMVLEPARKILVQEALPQSNRVCKVVPGKLGSALGDTCALMAVIDAVHQGRFTLGGGSNQSLVLESLLAGISLRQQTIVLLSERIAASGNAIIETLREGKKVLIFGNGGSAATAQHLAGELAGRYKAERIPLAGIALTADSSLVTCIGNDYGFEQIFSRQIQALAQPGDMAIGITTSGRSANVLAGLRTAKDLGLQTIALTGQAGLQDLSCDYVLDVHSPATAHIQEEHDAILHAWCELIDGAFTSS